MKPRLLLLTRPGCGLCEEFEAEFLAHFGAEAFELAHADVDSRLDWRTRYGLKIPVLLAADGALLCA
ncbi:MAG: glutaredoxin family protein, partial [Stenotrophobium sp.]